MKTEFKTNLRAILDSLGLTVKELSGRTGIPKGTLPFQSIKNPGGKRVTARTYYACSNKAALTGY